MTGQAAGPVWPSASPPPATPAARLGPHDVAELPRVRAELRRHARGRRPVRRRPAHADLRDQLILALDEMASNALRHGGGGVRAAVRLTARRLPHRGVRRGRGRTAGAGGGPRPQRGRPGAVPDRRDVHRARLVRQRRRQARLGAAPPRLTPGSARPARLDQVRHPPGPASAGRGRSSGCSRMATRATSSCRPSGRSRSITSSHSSSSGSSASSASAARRRAMPSSSGRSRPSTSPSV